MHIKIVALLTLALTISPLMCSCCGGNPVTYELIPASNSPLHIDHHGENDSAESARSIPHYFLQKPPTTRIQKLLQVGKVGAYGAGLLCAAGIVVSVSIAIPYLPYLVHLPSVAENLDYLQNISQSLLACPATQECFLKAVEHCG